MKIVKLKILQLKQKIHPKYYTDAVVTCSCGNTFTTGSTIPELKVEICSACHPFFTGQEKLIDTEGRVEKFQRMQSVANAQRKEYLAKVAAKKAAIDASKKPEAPKSLRDLLKEAKKEAKKQ